MGPPKANSNRFYLKGFKHFKVADFKNQLVAPCPPSPRVAGGGIFPRSSTTQG